VLLDPDQTVARRRPNEVTATDDEQQPGIGVLLLDASSSGATDGGASGGAAYTRSPVLAGIIGAFRAWTVAMISALSIPCK
jgi:hypothetical protein